jgi:phosphinothricin acetyltransferase
MQIRAADPTRDAAPCAAIYAPFVTDSAASFEEVAPDAAEFARRIERLQATHAYLVATDEQGVAGFAYGGPHRERAAYRWTTEVSVYIHERARQQGIGQALYDQLLPKLAERNYCLALAGVTLPNEPSVRLHEKCGFSPVGVYRAIGWKAGAWRDVGWWQRSLRTTQGPPADLH